MELWRISVLQLKIMMLASVVSSLTSPVAASLQGYRYAKPGCIDKCSNLIIPYPFGMEEPRCYHSPRFRITCDRSFTPHHEAFLETGNVEVTDIRLHDGQAEIIAHSAEDCYEGNATLTTSSSPTLDLLETGIYTISNTKNKLTAIGCNTVAIVDGYRRKQRYTTGCISICRNDDQIENGSCTGVGCCQTAIPRDLYNMTINLHRYDSKATVQDFSRCSYAAIMNQDKFNFSSNLLKDWQQTERLPMVIDWAIPLLNQPTCEAAKQNRSSYACGNYTECHVRKQSSGYHCKCLEGYEGKPYLPGGCTDVNECNNSTLHQCVWRCANKPPGNYTCLCPKWKHGDGRKNGSGCVANKFLVIMISAGIVIGIIIFLVAAFWFYFGQKKRKMMQLKNKFFQQNGGLMLQQRLSRYTGTSDDETEIFTAEELSKATNNFEASRMVGRGGYGTVYKGFLIDNRIVAIKKSKTVDPSQTEQFINEVIVLSKINHRNVVKLLGCCLETEVPLLVYEYIGNGTLYDHIHNKTEALPILSWEVRLRIATETAEVLSYLHTAASTPIIHRDIKPTNILLDDDYSAKVSDFGASKLVPMDKNELSTLVQGTLGYLDPEYLHTNQLTEKSDVYSFGVVLVELFTTRKAVSFERPEPERCLASHFLLLLNEDRLFEIVDHRIVNEENTKQIEEVAQLAKTCLEVKGEKRPSMKIVAMELQRLKMMGKPPEVNNELKSPEIEQLVGGRPESGTYGSIGSGSGGFDSTSSVQVPQLGGGR